MIYVISFVKAHEMNLEGLLHKHVEMVTQIKNLDTDLQMLVYENYNKFICATDSIKRYIHTLRYCIVFTVTPTPLKKDV